MEEEERDRGAVVQLQLRKQKRRMHPAFQEEDDDDDDSDDHHGADTGSLLTKRAHTTAICLEDTEAKAKRLTSEGVTLAVDGKYGHAIGRWNEAIALEPTPERLEMKAQALMEMYQYFPAIQAAEEALRLRPEWPAALLTLGRAQLNFGELLLAEATLVKAIAILARSSHTGDKQDPASNDSNATTTDEGGEQRRQAQDDLWFVQELIQRKRSQGLEPHDRRPHQPPKPPP
ncbi:hypothetical protein PTSG_11632 [Salpingoeca rosetta]|uniref:Tetratricopeptide repeat protein 33 n=1 Tax=Salpingoeca rosetta (strain ATCC 50818 / BSB-021) TaxID=946362 RepID=F2TX97_SALR5|nr:uncharacterized protein PTSG_11632 [Salpingoeca rosetta]EGD76006.1 hypothetical protein PTSG_11632 [Salpingoeca rosetta]|eukprot:XP_004998181.1 hypothetical protein PTSG_11632 [Salpingoeca rosetta]